MPDLRQVLPPIKKIETPVKKAALFGGVYNNHVALDRAAMLARERGAEALYCLGDLGGFGPSPNKVFPLLDRHNITVIQGNYEESLVNRIQDCGCGYTHPKDNHYAQISYDYTNQNLTEENRKKMAAFPKQIQFRLGEKSVHLCHGSPRRINEFCWESTTSTGFLATTAETLGADALCFTHTGIQWKRKLPGGRWAVNVGVLGRPPNDGKTNVWFAELRWENGEIVPEFVAVDYDHEALAKEMESEKLPAEFVKTIRTGWWTTCLEIMPGKERSRGRY